MDLYLHGCTQLWPHVIVSLTAVGQTEQAKTTTNRQLQTPSLSLSAFSLSCLLYPVLNTMAKTLEAKLLRLFVVVHSIDCRKCKI